MKFNNLIERYEAARAALMAEGKEAIELEFMAIFERHPELTVIKWNQYTPYFNDGEECTFSVNDFNVSNAPDIENVTCYGDYDGEEDEDEEGNMPTKVFVMDKWGDRNSKTWGDRNSKTYADVWELQEFAQSSIGEDLFRDIFDNHVTVVVTKDGIEVEEYEHD